VAVGSQTPLHLAAMLGHLCCARLLVTLCGADVNLQVKFTVCLIS
jgi:hypothetical protein